MCFWATCVGLKYIYISNITITSIVFEMCLKYTAKYIDKHLKLQSVSFASLSHLCLKPAIAVICGNIFFMWAVHQHGSSAQMNLMFWGVCVTVSHCTGVDIHCTLQSQILRLGSMTQIKNVTEKMSSEQVTCLPLLFWPTERKKHYNTLRYQ